MTILEGYKRFSGSGTTGLYMTEQERKVVLIVIDGWGISPEEKGNAIYHAKTPWMDSFQEKFPFAVLDASGLAVGLPDGLMGNSEVGHLNIGAGRIVYQDLVRINLAIENGSFFKNKVLVQALDNAKNTSGRIHFLGLVSDGGVHSHINHLFALLEAAKARGVSQAFIHAFTDGRDTPPTSATTYIQQLLDHLQKINYGKIATIMGRYYAMDRDKRWERTKIAFDAMVLGKGEKSTHPIETIKKRYENGETDEFLKPIILDEEGMIKDNDTLLFFDFRADRMRQIVESFAFDPPFSTEQQPKNVFIATMTEYKKEYPFPILYPPEKLVNVLAEWLSKQGFTQFHTAETEKYAHVTFFFNGGKEEPFPGEDRVLVPSPKVATYDLKPDMSLEGVKEQVISAMEKNYPFILCNLAPPDMVGHTGVYSAAIKAVEATDATIGEIFQACTKHEYILAITADHGNAEKMIDENGNPHTAHTTNPVPFIITNNRVQFKREKGILADVAPTILDLMGLPKPKEMNGKSLLG